MLIVKNISQDCQVWKINTVRISAVAKRKWTKEKKEISRKESSAGESLFAAFLISFGRSLGFIKYIDRSKVFLLSQKKSTSVFGPIILQIWKNY